MPSFKMITSEVHLGNGSVFKRLPFEIREKIFLYADSTDIRMVCRDWKERYENVTKRCLLGKRDREQYEEEYIPWKMVEVITECKKRKLETYLPGKYSLPEDKKSLIHINEFIDESFKNASLLGFFSLISKKYLSLENGLYQILQKSEETLEDTLLKVNEVRRYLETRENALKFIL